MKYLNTYMRLLVLATILFITSCSKDNTDTVNPSSKTFGIFKVLNDNKTIEMNGTIKSSSLNNFNKLYTAYPEILSIHIVECDGSMDDETNLLLSKRIYDLKINTHLLDNGLIASGGVDFFLAGIKRSKGSDTKIGVHSWAGEDDNGNEVTATDFPVGHEYHLDYINYYKSVGFTQKQAEDFYYFTINAAPADGIHWMTNDEIQTYHILTD